MDEESKGIDWFGDIYRKLETVLAEVDVFASLSCSRVSDEVSVPPEKQNDAQEITFVRNDPNGVIEICSSGDVDMKQCHDDLALLSFKDSSNPPSNEKFEILGSADSVERVDENVFHEKLSDSASNDEETRMSVSVIEEYIGSNSETMTNLTPLQVVNQRVSNDSHSNSSTEAQFTGSVLGSFRTEEPCNDYSNQCSSGHSSVCSNLVQVAAEIPVEEVMAKMRLSDSYSVKFSNGDQDDVCDDQHDATSLETIELYDMGNREDLSDVDDRMLYAVRNRTRKLRSLKKKITDALTPKRQREKEYEQLAIWFGDASMDSDLDTAEILPFKTATAIDAKGPLASEDSEWELL